MSAKHLTEIKVDCNIFDDFNDMGLTMSARLAMMFIMLHRRDSSFPGLTRLELALLESSCGLTKEQAKDVVEELTLKGLLVYDADYRIAWLPGLVFKETSRLTRNNVIGWRDSWRSLCRFDISVKRDAFVAATYALRWLSTDKKHAEHLLSVFLEGAPSWYRYDLPMPDVYLKNPPPSTIIGAQSVDSIPIQISSSSMMSTYAWLEPTKPSGHHDSSPSIEAVSLTSHEVQKLSLNSDDINVALQPLDDHDLQNSTPRVEEAWSQAKTPRIRTLESSPHGPCAIRSHMPLGSTVDDGFSTEDDAGFLYEGPFRAALPVTEESMRAIRGSISTITSHNYHTEGDAMLYKNTSTDYEDKVDTTPTGVDPKHNYINNPSDTPISGACIPKKRRDYFVRTNDKESMERSSTGSDPEPSKYKNELLKVNCNLYDSDSDSDFKIKNKSKSKSTSEYARPGASSADAAPFSSIVAKMAITQKARNKDSVTAVDPVCLDGEESGDPEHAHTAHHNEFKRDSSSSHEEVGVLSQKSSYIAKERLIEAFNVLKENEDMFANVEIEGGLISLARSLCKIAYTQYKMPLKYSLAPHVKVTLEEIRLKNPKIKTSFAGYICGKMKFVMGDDVEKDFLFAKTNGREGRSKPWSSGKMKTESPVVVLKTPEQERQEEEARKERRLKKEEESRRQAELNEDLRRRLLEGDPSIPRFGGKKTTTQSTLSAPSSKKVA